MIDNITPQLLERFWSKVTKTNSCWNWSANRSKRGYGYFYFNGKLGLAHRFSYMIFNNDIPRNLELDHLCRNHSCVNPSHLEAVSHKLNMYRGNSIQTLNAMKTHCKNGHKFTEDNLVKHTSKEGRRRCRICDNQYFRDYRRKMKLRK